MRDVLELRAILPAEAEARNRKDHDLRADLLVQAERMPGADALERVLFFLRGYGAAFPPFVRGDLLFAGTPGYFNLPYSDNGIAGDIGHYCPDYKKAVDIGVRGLRAEVAATRAHDEKEAAVRDAYLETADLFVAFMERHARCAEDLAAGCTDAEERDNLLRMARDIRYIESEKPATFLQGLQLILFQHIYVLLKPHTNTVTFGNLDRVLGGLYRSDVERGALTRERALEILCHFYLALEPMDRDTQNIVLGGSDENGNYFENDLTVLFLEAQEKMHLEEPAVSLKIRPDTSDKVWDAALRLLAKGGGMPSFLNDAVYIRSLKRAGFPAEEANTFCNVGCYEATPYGSAHGGTVSGTVRTVTLFADFFASGTDYADFDAFLGGWEAYLAARYENDILPGFRRLRDDIEARSAHPFLGLVMDGCVESLRLPEQYGAKYNIFSVLFEGIATVTDSLLCVKHFVYDTGAVTLDDYRKAVAENYPDGDFLAQIRAYPARFGSGDAESEALARREAHRMSELAVKHPLNERIRPMPALFNFTGDIFTKDRPATPDGRRAGERFSYGAAASELLPRRDTTKVLLSTASLPLDEFPIGAPMTVNLMGDVLKTEKGRGAVRSMIETYHRKGGTHIQFNIADPDVLRDAQVHPEQYKDLLIRISGHTEPFIRLKKELQDALIARSAMGC